MKKKVMIILTIFMLIILVVFNFSFAATIDNPMGNPNQYKPGGLQNADEVKNIGNVIIGIVQFIGSFVSVLVLIVMGIKYMTGSVEEKAEYKKTMVPYIIGAILVFAITNILGIVNSVTEGIFF